MHIHSSSLEKKDPVFSHDEGEQAFDYFFRKYFATLCVFAQTYLKDEESAKDLVQDSFVRFWETGEMIERQHHARSYLYTIVRNKCIDQLRRLKAREKPVNDYNYLSGIWSKEELDEVTRAELIRRIHTCIDELPHDLREVIERHYEKGEGYTPIAKDLNVTYDAVRKRKERAIQLIRKALHFLSSVMGYLIFFVGSRPIFFYFTY